MKSITELEEIKIKTLEKFNAHCKNDGFRVIIGMATCGIAAGAKQVMNAFENELKKRALNNVELTITGCIGVCRLEPLVDVIDKNNHKVTYVNVTPEKVARIVAEHIVNGRICLNYLGQ